MKNVKNLCIEIIAALLVTILFIVGMPVIYILSYCFF